MSALPTADAPSPDATISYGEHPDQVYDVRLPRADALDCTALLVHGGFWRPAYDRSHAASQADAFACNGFHVAAVEYRRATEGGWPQLSADVLAAARAVQADRSVPDRMVLVGHSAGGQLVCWLLHRMPGVLGAIALAGCVDLHLVERLGLDVDAARALMGSAPDEDEAAWDAADPACLGPSPVPVRLVHGTADDRVPLMVSRSYLNVIGGGHPRMPDADDLMADHDYLYAAEGDANLHVLDGAGHFDLIDPASAYFPATLEAARSLVR